MANITPTLQVRVFWFAASFRQDPNASIPLPIIVLSMLASVASKCFHRLTCFSFTISRWYLIHSSRFKLTTSAILRPQFPASNIHSAPARVLNTIHRQIVLFETLQLATCPYWKLVLTTYESGSQSSYLNGTPTNAAMCVCGNSARSTTQKTSSG